MNATTASTSFKGIVYAVTAVVVLLAVKVLWPFYSVPTGSRALTAPGHLTTGH